MAPRTSSVSAPDGRALAVYEGGRLDGTPVLALHGTPGSGLLYEPHVALAERQGIRLISYDRAGYGGSTPRPDRTIADVTEDVAAIADALGLERFFLWGISGGG